MVKIIFLHPDLGIGGAERLVVDAALAMKSKGHSVHILTAHHNPKHCFEETRDGTIPVTVAGDWLPRNFCGLFYAVFAYLRMIYAALYLIVFSGLSYDVVFCDQISACIPILRLQKSRILFYCHFPDQLLTKRESFLKSLYRTPLDWLEEKTTGMADILLVNSQFTASIFKETFSSLKAINPEVLYPSLNVDAFDGAIDTSPSDLIPKKAEILFLSINRYERKKNLNLALHAMSHLKKLLSEAEWHRVYLILAGGYDERVIENKEHYLELRLLSEELQLADQVSFLQSCSNSEKRFLLDACTSVIYTPDKEHFGIVPIEAMYMKKPVIAVRSGGPLETIVNDETGFLCEPEAESFATAMEKLVKDPQLEKIFGRAGRKRVEDTFSFKAFIIHLDKIITDLMKL